MRRSSLNLVCPLVAFAAVFVASSSSVAGTVWSLVDDFSLASNPNGAWTYQLEVTAGDDDSAYTSLDTNTRTANDIWGTSFASAPTMRSEASGFWGIGRNDTGATQTSANVFWDPNEVLFHPKPDFSGSGGRFITCASQKLRPPYSTTTYVTW